jgi:hypothetical protein
MQTKHIMNRIIKILRGYFGWYNPHFMV